MKLIPQGGFNAWFFYGILGIASDVASPGFKHLVMEPQLFNQLSHASGSLNSPYGLITSAYQWKGNAWTINLPPKTSATVRLVGKSIQKIRIDGKPIKGDRAEAGVSAGKQVVTVEE